MGEPIRPKILSVTVTYELEGVTHTATVDAGGATMGILWASPQAIRIPKALKMAHAVYEVYVENPADRLSLDQVQEMWMTPGAGTNYLPLCMIPQEPCVLQVLHHQVQTS